MRQTIYQNAERNVFILYKKNVSAEGFQKDLSRELMLKFFIFCSATNSQCVIQIRNSIFCFNSAF